jgi:hypothetical protein
LGIRGWGVKKIGKMREKRTLYPFTHLLIHSSTHPPIHSSTHPLIHSSTHPPSSPLPKARSHFQEKFKA